MAKKMSLAEAAAARKAKKAGVNVGKNYSANSFSFKGSNASKEYKAAARAALKSGKTVLAAHRAGQAADRAKGANKTRAGGKKKQAYAG